MAASRCACPKCGNVFGVLERQLGTEVYCPHCGQKVAVPAPKADAGTLQEEAAAQMLREPAGPAWPTGGLEGPSGPVERASREAVRAMERSAGAPSRPASRAGARKVPVAEAARPPGSDTLLAHHLGLDQQDVESSRLATAPVRSKAIVWVWSSIVVAVLLGIVVGLVYKSIEWRSMHRRAREDERARQAAAAAGGSRAAAPVAEFTRSEGPKPAASDPRTSPGARPPEEAVEEVKAPDPLTFRQVRNDTESGTLYYENKGQREVWVGYVENPGQEMVRRAVLQMTAIGAESGQEYGNSNIVFCDVKRGEKIPFVFDYRFVNESATKFAAKWVTVQTDKPEYEFDVTVRRIVPDGAKSGNVFCDVTNRTMRTAAVVDVWLVFFDRMQKPSGYTTAQLLNLGPREKREAKIRWENWDRTFVEYAEARAQIGGD